MKPIWLQSIQVKVLCTNLRLLEVSYYRGCICAMDLHSPINLIGMDGIIIVRRKCRRAIELDL